MAYKDKYGITAIEQDADFGSVDTFDISWDRRDDETDKTQRRAVFLVTPDKTKFDHEHVTLSQKGAKDLLDWLTAFLKDCS